jgi:methyl-accepting chemotaxis protein
VSVITATINTAVDEQGAATSDISRTVERTSQAVIDVTAGIGDASEGTNDTGRVAAGILAAASDLPEQAGQLSREVNSFVTGVRAA